MSDIIDSIDLGTVDGFDIRAELVPDSDSTPQNAGDYEPEQIAQFNNGVWDYVGIIVTASRAGTDLGSDSLWAVERGQFPAGDGTIIRNGLKARGLIDIDPLRDADGSLAYYREDMVGNAIADARLKLTELIDAAIDDSIDL